MCLSSIQASKEFSGTKKGISAALGDFLTNYGRIKLYKVLRIRSATLVKYMGLYHLSCNNIESLTSFSCKLAQGFWN